MKLGLQHSANPNTIRWYGTVFLFLPVVLLFLLAIDLVGLSVNSLSQEMARNILLATSNPFIGLFIGLLATALIQSSSTVTAMTVAVVSTGYLPLGSAIPVVMGANVGTTLTSTLVSLGFITNKNEFRKAISAGSVHDFFNIFTVILLFPLEYRYGILSGAAQYFTGLFGEALRVDPSSESSFINLGAISEWILDLFPNAIVVLLLSLVTLFGSIKLLSNIIYRRVIGNSKDRLKKYIFASPYKSFGWGTLLTAGMQSSSITTSMIVPLVASGRVTLKKAFPFILGANIGTTITALIAAFNQSEAAISLAFVHLLFNLFGVLFFLPFPPLRRLPVLAAYRFGALTLDSRIIGLSYIIFTFFLLPFTLIYINKDSSEQRTYTYAIEAGSLQQERMIAFNAVGLNAEMRYLLYEAEKVDGRLSVPDTSLLLANDASGVVTPRGFVDFDDLVCQIDDSAASSTYEEHGLSLQTLSLVLTTCANGSVTEYLFNSENMMLVKAIKKDSIGEIVETVKLIDIN